MAQLAVIINIPNVGAAALPTFVSLGEEVARLVRNDIGDNQASLQNTAVSDLAIIPQVADPSTGTVTAASPASDKSKSKTLTPNRSLIAGGAPGNLTVTGIKTTNKLLAVLKIVDAGQAFTDLTSEFTITAANTINNTAGTTTASSHVAVVFV